MTLWEAAALLVAGVLGVVMSIAVVFVGYQLKRFVTQRFGASAATEAPLGDK